MIIYVLATMLSVAVVAGLSSALYAWFTLSLRRFHAVVAQDVLTQWDAQMAALPEYDREHQRAHPPVEVLEAILALPSARQPRFQPS
jgi:hypothetical protein